ncbi:hypothetical protein ACROYT_G012752 [Oculina patagonica]
MVKTNFIATLMILQGFLFLYVQPWYFPYSCSYDNGNYNVSWTFNETSDRLYFKVEVNTTGWVGFGLANEAPTNMTDYDVAVGGVYDNGSCYLQDYLTIGWRQPQLDLQQDWKLINCSEDNGVTTLFFCRAKNTSDENDTVVEEGKSIYIIWAYHDTTDVTDMSFPKHTARGYDNKTLCPAETSTSTIISPSPTTSSVSSPTTSSVSSSTTSSVSSPTTSSVSSPTTSSVSSPTTSSVSSPTTSSVSSPTTSSVSSSTTSSVGGGVSATTTAAGGGGGGASVTTTAAGGGGGGASVTTTAAGGGGGGGASVTTTAAGGGGGGGASVTTTAAGGGGGGGASVTTTAAGGGGGASVTTTAAGGGGGGGASVTTTAAGGGGGGGGMSTTTTQTTASSSSVVVNKKPGPTVTLTLKVTIACSGNVQTLNVSLQIDILGIYVKAGFSVKFVKTKSISCNSPLNMALDMSFYSPIPEGKTIQGVFEEALKNGSIRNLTTSNTEATFTFIGATVKYKPKAGQCKQVCCDGAGGEMIVVPECTPADKCEGILLKEKKEDGHCPKDSIGTCTVECDDDDSGGIHNSPNFAAVVLLAIATFVK